MPDLSEKLLEQAINSILHGSTQLIQTTDQNGITTYQEIRINDLRQSLIEKLANKLVQTQEFKDILIKAFSFEIIKQIRDNAINKVSYQDLPWDIKSKIERQMKEAGVEIKKYRLIAEEIIK